MSEEGRYIKGGDGSHWVGCEETHWDCKIARLEKENTRLKKAVDEAKIIIYPIAAVGYKGFKQTTIKETIIKLCGEWYEKFGYGGKE